MTKDSLKIMSRTSPLGLHENSFQKVQRTCGMLLFLKNVPPKIIQEMLGHATIPIALDTYSYLLPSITRGAVSAMEDLSEED